MAENKTEIAKVSRVEPLVTMADDSLYDTDLCNHIQWLAERFAGSDITPGNFRNKPENCFIVIHQAKRLKVDPLMMMQKTYVVHGKMGMEAQLAIALVNARGPFKEGIQWELSGEGMGRSCTAWAVRKGSKNKCEATASMKMAEDNGWMKPADSKWRTLPDLMLRYRSAMFLARLYCPEVLLGMLSSEELRDIEAAEPPPPLVSGRQAFGKAKVKQLAPPEIPEAATDPEVIDVEPKAPETAPEPSEAPTEPPADVPDPGEGFTPALDQYVKNGPRGMIVRVTCLDPPTFMKDDGTVHPRSLWPPNTMAWDTDSKDSFTDGDGVVHPGTFAALLLKQAGEAAPEPEPAPPADQGPDPELPGPLGAVSQQAQAAAPTTAAPATDPGPFDEPDSEPTANSRGTDDLNKF